MVRKIYISGPITGTDDYMERFMAANDKLVNMGFTVIDPAYINERLPEGTTHEEYMQISLVLLNMCDYIYMLDGWEKSIGANREYGYALAKGMTIFYE